MNWKKNEARKMAKAAFGKYLYSDLE